MSGAPCCELCKLVWESVLSCASWCGICELLCLLFGSNPAILRVFVPSLLIVFSCFCNMGNAASSSRASPTDEALRPVFKSFFCKLFGKLQVLKERFFKYFSRWVSRCNTYGWGYCSSSRWDWSWNSPCSLKCGEMSYFREGCCLNSKCEAWPCLAFFFDVGWVWLHVLEWNLYVDHSGAGMASPPELKQPEALGWPASECWFMEPEMGFLAGC